MKSRLIFTALLLASLPSGAFMTVQESNEITPAGKYKIGMEPQVRLSDGTGINFTGFFDRGINDEGSFRAWVGTGDTDLTAGGSLKWVPFPDYGSQPAVGLKVGGSYWREHDENFFTVRLDPIVSKKFESDIGLFIPYVAIPVMFHSGQDKDQTGIQVAAGTEFLHTEADNMTFGAEVGFDAKDSFSYISGYVTIYLDEARPNQL